MKKDLGFKDWPVSRRYQRYAVDLRVKVIVQGEGKDETIHARTSHLGLGGLGVILTRELERGTIVKLEFALPGCEPFNVRSELRHRAGFRCGFAFLELKPEHRLQLKHFLNELPATTAISTP